MAFICFLEADSAPADFEADVVYVHKWEHLPSLRGLVASGRPLIRMVHDHDTYCLRSYKYDVLTRKICTRPAGLHCIFPCLAPIKRNRDGGLPLKWVSYFAKLEELALNRQFDRHLVVTNYMKNELVINGLSPDRIEIFPPVPRPGIELRSTFSDRNLLLYAGQLIRGKGVDVLLRALAKVESRFEAIILGDGNHRAACEKLSRKLGLEGRVTFKGFIPQAELTSYYRDTSAVMISSRLAGADRHHRPGGHALRAARGRVRCRRHQGLAARRAKMASWCRGWIPALSRRGSTSCCGIRPRRNRWGSAAWKSSPGNMISMNTWPASKTSLRGSPIRIPPLGARMKSPARPLVIGIAGGSASGKSHLANHLLDKLPRRSALALPGLVLPGPIEFAAGPAARAEFRSSRAPSMPPSFAATCGIAGRPPGGDARVTTTPRTAAAADTVTVHPASLIIVEGLLVLHDARLRRLFDLSVFVDLPADVRLLRRVSRDLAERGIEAEETMRLYEHCVRPMHERFVAPSARHASSVWQPDRDAAFPAALVKTLLEKMA